MNAPQDIHKNANTYNSVLVDRKCIGIQRLEENVGKIIKTNLFSSIINKCYKNQINDEKVHPF